MLWLSEMHTNNYDLLHIRYYNYLLFSIEPDSVSLAYYKNKFIIFEEIHINRNIDLIEIRREEVSAIQIKFNNLTFSIVKIYVPYSNNYQHISIRKLSELSQPAIYIGD